MFKTTNIKTRIEMSQIILTQTEITEKDIPKIFELHENEIDQTNIISITFYARTITRYLIYIFLTFISFGFIYLLCRWNLSLKLLLFHHKCLLEESKYILITLADKRRFLLEIRSEYFQTKDYGILRYYKLFDYKLYRYYYDPELSSFRLIRSDLTNFTNTYIHEKLSKGLPISKIDSSKVFYGPNSIEVCKASLTKIFLDEITSPYFIFPILSCVVWFLETYQIYASVILFFTILSVIMNIHSESTNMKKLQTISSFKMMVTGYRGVPIERFQQETFEDLLPYKQTFSSLDLLPGDVIEIPENSFLPADMVLLNGTCIVNEIMIIGESTPVKKNALPYDDQVFNPHDENKTSMLYSGTICLETRFYNKEHSPILGLVYDTGFNALKSQLVRSVLFPKPCSFSFYQDSLKFILAMGVISLFGLGWTVYTFEKYESDAEVLIFACLDMITVIIPPALPTCLSFGIAFAMYRLRTEQIFCICPDKINIAGKIDILCFGKTGTLTEEGLELKGLIPMRTNDNNTPIFGSLSPFQDLYKTIEAKSVVLRNVYLNTDSSLLQQAKKTKEAILLELFCCCHSLTHINEKLIGDPLDIKMFEETGWRLEENCFSYDNLLLAVVSPPHSKENIDFLRIKENLNNDTLDLIPHIGIIKRFEFSSRLQRMSVIVKNMNEVKFRVHVKGSPEKLRELCNPESIPKNFHETLEKYSREGLRVLACASRSLKTSMKLLRNLERNEVEKNLIFLGFLISENKIKNVTNEVLEKLHQADIRTIMMTGDNILTGISVAKQCELIPKNQRVYYSEINHNNNNKNYDKTEALGIRWLDFDCSDNVLNPKSLKIEEKFVDEKDMLLSEMLDSPVVFQNKNEENFENNYKDIVIESYEVDDNGKNKNGNDDKRNENYKNNMDDRNNDTIKNILQPTGQNFNEITSNMNSRKLLFCQTNEEILSSKASLSFEKSKYQRKNSISLFSPDKKSHKIENPNPILSSINYQIENTVNNNLEQKYNSIKNSLNRMPSIFKKSAPIINIIGPQSISKKSFLFRSSQIYKFILEQNGILNEKDNQTDIRESHPFSLAITGQVFSYLLKDKKTSTASAKLFDQMLEKTQIYARMKPKEKALLIQELQNKYKTSLIGMCGDGANDCAALSLADVGISLSDAEASIAAPFTSKIHDISCILVLLREGRCALATSLQCFKYMLIYSIIQFTSVGILYCSFSYLSNIQYLWIDLGIIIPITLLMGYTKPTKDLSKYLPTSNLLSFPILASMIGQIIIQFSFQLFTYLITIKNMPSCDEKMANQKIEEYSYCYETTSVFLVANFEYLSTIIAFSIGPPFRKPIYANYGLSFTFIVLFFCCLYLLSFPNEFFMELIPIEKIDYTWKLNLLAIILTNFLVTFLYEKVVVNLLFYWWKNEHDKKLSKFSSFL